MAEQTISYYMWVLNIAKQAEDRPGEGEIYANLGNAFYRLGDFHKAIEYQELSLKIAKEVGDRHGEGHCYANLGNAYHQLSDFQKSIEYQERSLSIAKDVEDRPGEGECYANLGNAYRQLGDFQKAVEYQKLSLSIAKQLGNLAQEARACYALGCVYQVLGLFHEALNYFQSSVALLHSEEISQVPNLYEDVHTHLWRTLLEIERANEALYDVGSLAYRRIVVTADILNYISAQTAFVTLEGEIVNFCVCCKETGVQFIQKKVESEGENATAFTQRLINSALKEIAQERNWWPSGKNSSLRLLYDTVIGPIAHVLNSEELIIVPDGPLCMAPFAAFVDQNAMYLSETTRIRMIPSLTFLKQITSCPPDYHSRCGALLVGDPWIGGTKLSPLPVAREEVEMIGAILHTPPLTGKMATKEQVLKLITSVALVHIACYSGEYMETAGIVLSPRTSKAPIREEEYMLTTADVLAVQIRARLVVLRCDAGPSTIRMAHAFLSAGARSVLVSIWPLDDNAALAFLHSFYKCLVGGNRTSVALQQAMKCLRETCHFSAVKYWASFVLIGDDVTLGFDDEKEEQ